MGIQYICVCIAGHYISHSLLNPSKKIPSFLIPSRNSLFLICIHPYSSPYLSSSSLPLKIPSNILHSLPQIPFFLFLAFFIPSKNNPSNTPYSLQACCLLYPTFPYKFLALHRPIISLSYFYSLYTPPLCTNPPHKWFPFHTHPILLDTTHLHCTVPSLTLIQGINSIFGLTHLLPPTLPYSIRYLHQSRSRLRFSLSLCHFNDVHDLTDNGAVDLNV